MSINIEENKIFQTDSLLARAKTSYVELDDSFNPDYSKERLVVHTKTSLSMLKMARKDSHFYHKYIEILSQDYTLIGHKTGYSIFMKREKYSPEKVAIYKYLNRHKGLIYTLSLPELKRSSKSLPNRLLVLFSHMNGGGGYDSNNAIERMFVQFFKDIQRSLVKNVYILRIADLNLSHGSYFVNTPNYPSYENEVQELINNVRKQYNISRDNVILYGGSKGGAGALLHAAIGNYKAVAGDPIINASKYNEKDWHFIKNFREADLTDRITLLSKKNSNKMYIFSSRVQPFNYKASTNLAKKLNGLAHVVELSDDVMVKTHPHITAQSIPEQITLMNLLFDGEKILGKELGEKANKL